MFRCYRLVALFVLVVFVATAQFPIHAQEGSGLLRAVHFLTDASKLDIYLDGKVVLANLGYQDASTYAAIPTGTHELNFGVAGKDKPGSSPITLQVAAGDMFTFVFSGTLADKAPDVYVTSESGLAQQNKLTLFDGTMPLLFVQGSKAAGTVDVYVNDQLAGSVSNAASMLINVPLASYTLKVTAAGDANKVLVDTAGVAFIHAVGVIGLNGTPDSYSLNIAYSSDTNAAEFLSAQIEPAPLKFDALLEAAGIANLGGTLTDAGALTIFAPENSAFDKVDPTTLNNMFADSASASKVIGYHVLAEPLVYDDILTLLMNNGTQKTMQGADMTFGLKEQIELGGTPIKLIAWNIHTSNAVIHVIDSLLVPPAN